MTHFQGSDAPAPVKSLAREPGVSPDPVGCRENKPAQEQVGLLVAMAVVTNYVLEAPVVWWT